MKAVLYISIIFCCISCDCIKITKLEIISSDDSLMVININRAKREFFVDLRKEKYIIKTLYFGNEIDDIYQQILEKRYSIHFEDISWKKYHKPIKFYYAQIYTNAYNKLSFRNLKNKFGENIFTDAYNEAQKKHTALKEKNRNKQRKKYEKVKIVFEAHFDSKFGNKLKPYIAFINYKYGYPNVVENGESIAPGNYHYRALCSGYHSDRKKIRISPYQSCVKLSVFLKKDEE